MDSVQLLLQALPKDPGDDAAWLALADALEEQGDPRGESTRLSVWLRRLDHPDRAVWEARLHELVETDVRVCLPRQRVRLAEATYLEMVLIPPGSFLRGSPEPELERQHDENQHWVMLTKGFWLGIYSVTQRQWQAVMGNNPSRFVGSDRPAEEVSWYECQEFCSQLSERKGQHFRLLTEAEWEYACRAGTTTPYSFGETITPSRANYDCNYSYNGGDKGIYREETLPVGSFPANAWGIHDMHGNLYDWCLDWYGDYRGEETTDPQGPAEGDSRVLRGGSWYSYPRRCRSAFRYHYTPDGRDDIFGFRLALSLE